VRDLRRVVVVGTSASGKTTLARALAKLLAAPHVELDALHWGAEWTRRHDFADRVQQLAKQPTWVVDGNYSEVRDALWSRANAIIWLNHSFSVTFGRALRRTAYRLLSRERLWANNRESFRRALFDFDGTLWWVLRSYRRRRREIPSLMVDPRFAHVEFIVLCDPEQATRFLRNIELLSSLGPDQ
jgi:adenylate kinase family enzyme